METAATGYPFAYYHIDDVSLTNVTSINEIEQMSFELYPNPTSNFLTIVANKIPSRISVINSFGKCEISIEPNSHLTIFDISNLVNGIYLVKIGNKTDKLIVQR